MSIFFSGSPKRNSAVAAIMNKFKVLLDYNFKSTNTLMTLLSKHLKRNSSFQHITVDTEATIEENVSKLATAITQVQDFINVIDIELASLLEPTLYMQLTNPETTFKHKFTIVKESLDLFSKIDRAAIGLTIVGAIKAWSALEKMIEVLGVIKKSPLAGIVLGVVTQGGDAICCGGALKEKIVQFQKELSQFEPISREYTKAATRMDLVLQISLKKIDCFSSE